MSVLSLTTITARDLPDAWAQCVFKLLEPGAARKRQVGRGSFEGEYRLEFDYVTVHVLYPGARPLIPDIPASLGIPAPVENMDKVEAYFARYLMSDYKEGNEQYTYGERIVSASGVNQVDEVIKRYRDHGPGNNQLIIQVAQPSDLTIQDPPCLRHIDTRVEGGKLHFIIYFRSWDLWGGFPENLAGLQLLKEYMAGEIGVEDGEMICSSKGLHLYGYTWEIAGIRRLLAQNRPWAVQGDVDKSSGWPSGLLVGSQARSQLRERLKTVERAGRVESPVAELREKGGESERRAESIEETLNTCLLQWTYDRQQPHLLIETRKAMSRIKWVSDERAIPYSLGRCQASPEDPHSLIFDELCAGLLQRFEESTIIEGLSKFLIADVEKARLIAKRAITRFPESQKLQKILKLLSPSKVVASPATGPSRKADFNWVKANRDRHKGQWVALYRGDCVAAGKDLSTVRDNARKQRKLEEVLITYFPEERDREVVLGE